MVEPKPLQRVGEEIPHRRRPSVVAVPAIGRIAQRTELDADKRAVALGSFQRLADQHFVMAHAVEVAGIEQIDAGIEGGVDGGDALRAIGRSIHARHAHAAEAQGRNARPRFAELTVFHPQQAPRAVIPQPCVAARSGR
jgi:hypothetical protein